MGYIEDSSGLTVNNNAGGTISATAQWLAEGIQAGQTENVVNNGTITCTATGGQQGTTANQAYACAIGAGCSTGNSLFFENNGAISAICTSTTATNNAQCVASWANGPATFINNGYMYSANLGPKGTAEGFYWGAQGYDLSLYNSGTITNYSPNGNGYAVWMENDANTGNMHICNSGTISSPGTSTLLLTVSYGPPGNIHVYYTNTATGTFIGGTLAFCLPATAWESGQIHTAVYGYENGSDVHITGLPTIDPVIDGGGSGSTLNFNLTGTLQQINGQSAGGSSFSGLGSSGSIVVSGKTYKWNNFASGVSGTITASSLPANGTYKLINQNSGLALDANGAQTGNGTQIIQWSYNAGSNQKWTLTSLGGNVYKIIGVQSGRSLDIFGGQSANGTKVDLWDYNGGSNQQFAFTPTGNGYYRITPLNATGSCLDVYYASTAAGAVVDLWQWFGGTNPQQQWSPQAP